MNIGETQNKGHFYQGGARLDTYQLDTINHSDRCLEAFHCSSAVNGSCSIDSCPNGGHPFYQAPVNLDPYS